MLEQAPSLGHVDLFAVDRAVDRIMAEFPVAAERNKDQIDAIGVVFLRCEDHLASVAWEDCFIAGISLHMDVKVLLICAFWLVGIGLELDQSLIQLVHFAIDIDVVLGRPIRLLVFIPNAFLHNEAKSVA